MRLRREFRSQLIIAGLPGSVRVPHQSGCPVLCEAKRGYRAKRDPQFPGLDSREDNGTPGYTAHPFAITPRKNGPPVYAVFCLRSSSNDTTIVTARIAKITTSEIIGVTSIHGAASILPAAKASTAARP
ncbi:hypothetical protein SAMN05443244_1397 [Terriglobus roseus]|uniref:Uncharacterized protein n=1 Tax=Terriglobus roseus TaxID=392734 RepID=A0A1H4KYX5_9BACT|nr:hypothetical protein SAMN05443244_1397 [Terriglobus roseus]